jgi:hypothetical protein
VSRFWKLSVRLQEYWACAAATQQRATEAIEAIAGADERDTPLRWRNAKLPNGGPHRRISGENAHAQTASRGIARLTSVRTRCGWSFTGFMECNDAEIPG